MKPKRSMPSSRTCKCVKNARSAPRVPSPASVRAEASILNPTPPVSTTAKRSATKTNFPKRDRSFIFIVPQRKRLLAFSPHILYNDGYKLTPQIRFMPITTSAKKAMVRQKPQRPERKEKMLIKSWFPLSETGCRQKLKTPKRCFLIFIRRSIRRRRQTPSQKTKRPDKVPDHEADGKK